MTDRAVAVINGAETVKSSRFVKTLRGKKALDRARRLVGLKDYVTNMPATRISAAEVVGDYHGLWRVEKSFRMGKSDLKARPIFHRTDLPSHPRGDRSPPHHRDGRTRRLSPPANNHGGIRRRSH